VRRDQCPRQRLSSKPSSQRFTVQALGGIIHQPEAGLARATEFKAPSNCCLLAPASRDVNAYWFRHHVIAEILWVL
jgi:hypothetical protein